MVNDVTTLITDQHLIRFNNLIALFTGKIVNLQRNDQLKHVTFPSAECMFCTFLSITFGA